MPSVSYEIVQWTDEGFPGWVQARFIDADGKVWVFEDKAAVPSAGPLTSATPLPAAGSIRCVVVDEDQVVGKTIIDTSSPDGVTAVDGVTTRFAVRSSAVTRQAAAQICLIRAAITTRTSELFEGGRGTTVAETVSV